jgi:hypothetical protein
MQKRSEIAVTLSGDLLDRLRIQAQQLHVPLKWLVAGLVVDTSEAPSSMDDRTCILRRSAAPAA